MGVRAMPFEHRVTVWDITNNSLSDSTKSI
jgi:hypothetical protein